MRQLFLCVLPYSRMRRIKTKFGNPCLLFPKPVFKPLLPFVLADKILEFHQIKFKSPEDEVSWGDLITECLPYRRDAKGNALARGSDDIFKIHKHRLRDLSSKINR